jgi:LPXTG-site transpeptidase (sortase) family protein
MLKRLFSFCSLLRLHHSLLAAVIFSLLVVSRSHAAEPAPGALLTIPALNLSAEVVTIPLDPSIGTWNTTQITTTVGHFEYTPWLGERGNIVIGGHHTLADGTPSVFYDLEAVAVGDRILLSQGDALTEYEVTRVRAVAIGDLSVLYPHNSDSLTLITCAGYNGQTGIYERRLVVTAVPVG